MRAPTSAEWWYSTVVAVLFFSAVALSVGMNIIADPSRYGDQLGWFFFWAGLVLVAAAGAIVIYRVKRTRNHQITWTKNGLTILSIYATALCFNFPASWSTGLAAVPAWSTLIGWLFIVLTLSSLVPIWKAEAKDAEEKIEEAKAKKKAENEAANRKATVGNGDVISKGPRGRKTR